MKRVLAIVAAMELLALTACTTRAGYETIRASARSECDKKPSESERAACLERTQDSYEEFSRKRAEVEK